MLVALSGGVDSAVAAAILKKAGHQLTAVTMKICARDESSAGVSSKHGCYGPGEASDIEDAQKGARRLGIEHHVIDLCGEYGQTVLGYFSD